MNAFLLQLNLGNLSCGSRSKSNMLLLLVFISLSLSLKSSNGLSIKNDKQLDPRASTAEIIRARGYQAKNIKFVTSEGYILNLIRAKNPLIKNGEDRNKSVVLFLHGMTMNSRSYVLNSVGTEPQNHAYLSAADLDEWELGELLAHDNASNSLVFSLLNFGHDVWLADRRGTLESQGHVDSKRQAFKSSPLWRLGKNLMEFRESLGLGDGSAWLRRNMKHLKNVVNLKYWDYSLDEQAKVDLPEMVDFILAKTCRRKLSLVGHSAGAAIILMSLLDHNLANKTLKALLWSPSVGLGNEKSGLVIGVLAPNLEEVLTKNLGPIYPNLMSLTLQQSGISLCSTQPFKDLICSSLISIAGGSGGGQQEVASNFFAAFPDVISLHEAAQLVQSVKSNALHYFDYKSPEQNRQIYGSPTPPAYNLSRLDNFDGLSIWYGNTDSLTTPADQRKLLEQLRVPVEVHSIGDSNLSFNHFSFLIHRNISRHLILPALQTIERGDTLPGASAVGMCDLDEDENELNLD